MRIEPQACDALVVVDMQADFVSGSLAVAGAAGIVPIINRYVGEFRRRGLPVVATRDWHPRDHASFHEQGGPWPAHCVAGTAGAAFAAELELPRDALVVSKAIKPGAEAYSGFEDTDLDATLRRRRISRLFVAGVATEYCVLNTVRDALRLHYRVYLLVDAIRAVDASPGDGDFALRDMQRLGAHAATLDDISEPAAVR